MARGFTLVEVLVALTAFGILAMSGAGIAAGAMDGHRQLELADARVRDVQLARAAIKSDLSQVVARPVREGYGGRQPWSFAGGRDVVPPRSEETVVLAFVRAGWVNPEAAEPRSSLQYVEYRLAGADLVRVARPFLDATPDTPELRSVLLRDAAQLSVAFLSGGARVPQWRVAASSGGPWPDAVAIEIDVPDLGLLTQLFQVGRS
jgi:general secretion pathway protein J